MTDIKHLLLIIIIAFALCLAKAGRADDLTDCRNTLHLCDKSVSLRDAQVDALGEQIRLQQDYIKGLESHVKEEPFPWYFWTILGAAAGAAGVIILK